MKARSLFFLISFFVFSIIGGLSWLSLHAFWALVVALPLFWIGIKDVLQSRQAIRSNFPVIGRLRYFFESIRPEIMQYFVETDTEGRPFNRINRSIVYQRAKNVRDTTPFGTQKDVYQSGYEWMSHSIFAKTASDLSCDEFRVSVGGPQCQKPYIASRLNISAMSFGSLSQNAILALNKGAKTGNFAHNTGEGSISPYHLKHGGDLIWQIGTGYFGCRTEDGVFSPEKFKEKATLDSVKMIEIKLSQGAKPGHGGILPATKNTPETARIRGVKPHTSVHSPPAHTAFRDVEGMMGFIQTLRELSGGKPIGFKICIGIQDEFVAICRAMLHTGIYPDFITVDGSEGGTGAAPVEFSDSLGMPLRDALAFVDDMLRGFGLREHIRVISSGRIISSFDIARVIALGADMCNGARSMMMALGCIQALKCNDNNCPTGVATQNKTLMKGLNVDDKAKRVRNYHYNTIRNFIELLAASGFDSPDQIERKDILRRVSLSGATNYENIYPSIPVGSLLKPNTIPDKYKHLFQTKAEAA